MEGALHSLGVDWKLLLAQLVNFGIVALVLWRFAWKPLVKGLEERSARIGRGLDDARDAAESKKSAVVDRDAMLAEARAAAQQAVQAAEAEGAKRREEQLARAKDDVARALAEGQTQLAAEREKMMAEIKGDLAGLVASAVEAIAKQKLDPQKDAALITAALDNARTK